MNVRVRTAVIALLAACSRTASVEPVPLPERIRVTFPMGDGVEHEITDPIVLGRFQVLVNADLVGWRDISGFGKDPIPRARVLVDAGGHRLGIAVGDLERTLAEPLVSPTDEDGSILRAILDRAASQPPTARPGDLENALRGLFPGNTHERRTLMAILGYCGGLQPTGKSGFYREFTPFTQRDPPPSNKNDWPYPVSWWRGSDGVNREAARYWFGQYLLAS